MTVQNPGYGCLWLFQNSPVYCNNSLICFFIRLVLLFSGWKGGCWSRGCYRRQGWNRSERKGRTPWASWTGGCKGKSLSSRLQISFNSHDKTALFVHLQTCLMFFHQGQEGKPGKIGERGKPGEKVCQFTSSELKYTFHFWMSVNLLSCTRGWIVLCGSGKQ